MRDTFAMASGVLSGSTSVIFRLRIRTATLAVVDATTAGATHDRSRRYQKPRYHRAGRIQDES